MGFMKKSTTSYVEEKSSSNIQSENIVEITKSLMQKSSEGLAAIEELKGTMEQIAAAAEENAGASEESLSAIEEIDKNAQNLQKESNFILDISSRFASLIKEANQSILEDKEKMRITAEYAKEISMKADQLFESSKEIDSAVGLITKLAKKTSLLALNAAIEAARAKEKGKSFTIMASEIRAIASKSNQYVGNIKEIVHTTQEEITKAKDVMSELAKSMQEAGAVAQNSSELMENIVTKIDESIVNVQQVVQTVSQTAKEVRKLQQSAEVIASAAEESASAVSEITNTIAQQVEAFSQAQEAASMIESLVQKIEHEITKEIVQELAAASEELSSSNEELEHSMEQVVEALAQIEEAAQIAKDDAQKSHRVAEDSLSASQEAKELIGRLYEYINAIDTEFAKVIENLKNIQQMALKNTKESEEVVPVLNHINSKITSLHNIIRKIELSIVQISALSINGSVEAIRAGEYGSGFSEVSRDIKDLSSSSEEYLDRVIAIIDRVKEENDQINVLVNNIVLTQRAENEKIERIQYELATNKENLSEVLQAVDKANMLIETIVQALEQSKIAAEQIVEAANLSHTSAVESKEAAKIILDIAKDMKMLAQRVYELAQKLDGEE